MSSYPPSYDAYAAAGPPAGAPAPSYTNSYPGYGAAAPYGGYGEEIRTAFITGFPPDVKERELNNMLRFLPGYEASQMNWKQGQAQGFALFSSNHFAAAAVQALSGMCFDETAVLRCELAHKNMYFKDADNPAKRARPGPTDGAAAAYGTAPPPPYYGAAPAAAPRPQGYAPVTTARDNPPCDTLFLGNLGDAIDENELRSFFAAQPGFMQMKMVRNERGVTAFVQFDSVNSAMACHSTQQGAVLATSDRGGIRIQYAKGSFGKKRDRDEYAGGY